MSFRELRNAALEYADRGWAVLPLWGSSKAPMGSLVPHGKDDATSDLATVLRWFQRVGGPNIGINCHASGLLVLDVDPRHGGDDDLYELERELGELPRTLTNLSGGGGAHYLFRHPGVATVGKLAPGVDVKDHGYIVAPPSVHPSGRRYEWENPDDDVLELPARWLERITTRHIGGTAADFNLDPEDDLRRIPADVYVPKLTGREVTQGYVRCPFHSGGDEAEPSLRVEGSLWACYGCAPILGKRAMGGNLYDFAGLLWGYAIPLRGVDFTVVADRLRTALS